MNEVNVGKAICAVLDPILVPAGFQPGQGADERSGKAAGLTFCAGHDDFSERFPWMPQANEYEQGSGYCIDLVIATDFQGVVDRLDLESYSLEETLRLVARDDDAKSAELVGRDYTEALAVLPGMLGRLLRLDIQQE